MVMTEENEGAADRLGGLLDRYTTQIEQTRALGLLDVLASRTRDADALAPEAMSAALDALEDAAWAGAEMELQEMVDDPEADPVLATAVVAGLACERTARPAVETLAAFRERVERVKRVLQSWIAVGAAKELDPLKTTLERAADVDDGETVSTTPLASMDLELEDSGPPPQFRIEIAHDLVPLVDDLRGGQLVRRIRHMRKSLSEGFGFTISPIHLRDDLRLDSGVYRLQLRGQEVASGRLMVSRLMAIDPGDATAAVEGVATTEPAFGLPAYWIDPTFQADAVAKGYTVVDPETVLVTHLGESLQASRARLFGWEEFQAYLEGVDTWAPGMFAELVPGKLSLACLHQVLRNLLEEGIGINDARTIFERLAANVDRANHPHPLTEAVRQGLGKRVVAACLPEGQPILRLGESLAAALESCLVTRGDGAIDLEGAGALLTTLREGILAAAPWADGASLAVVVPARVRGPLMRALGAVVDPLPTVFLTVADGGHLDAPRGLGQIELTSGFVSASPT